jgi:hypothetical protein
MSETLSRQNYEAISSDVRALLTSDMRSRIMCKWPLILQERDCEKFPFKDGRGNIHEEFPFLDLIFAKYKGEICAAGGAVANHLFREDLNDYELKRARDVDLFFYGIREDRATQILEDCIAMLCSAVDYIGIEKDILPPKHMSYRQVRVERNTKYVNVSFTRYGGPIISRQTYRVYQFILRIYPTLDSVIGGFDIPFSSFAFDGERFWSTEIADWCMKNGMMIANISRRSPSFEHRLVKYCTRYDLELFFPGLDRDKFFARRIADHSKLLKDVEAAVIKNYHAFIEGVDDLMTEFYQALDSATMKKDWPIFHRIVFPNSCVGVRMSSSKYKDLHLPTKEQTERISDYSQRYVEGSKISNLNSNACILDNPDVVIVHVSYTTRPEYETVVRDFREMMINPQVVSLDSEHLFTRCKKMVRRMTNNYGQTEWVGLILKSIGVPKLSKGINKIETQAKLLHSALMVKHDKTLETAVQNLKGLRWITKNLHQQWTSSHHPIHASAAEYYGEFHKRFEVGIPWEIMRLLLLGMKEKDCQFSRLGRDMFKYVMLHLLQLYGY